MKGNVPRFALAAGLLAIAGLLMLVFSRWGSAFFPAYRDFSKALMTGLSTACSFAPFALWDVFAIPLALALLISLVVAIVRTRSLWRWLANVCVIVAALLLFLVSAWGLNHYAPPLAREIGLDVSGYSADELASATRYYLEAAAERADAVPRGEGAALASQDFEELARICGSAYSGLDDAYPLFVGSTVPVKALTVAGEPLLYWGYVGIFWPFTGESSVPPNCAAEDMPFTMCHEAAHRLGIASEQEANFAAFLACTASDDTRLAYAGYYAAFNYCFNALASTSPGHAQQLIADTLGDSPDPSDPHMRSMLLVLLDRQNANAHYQPYKGPVEQAGTAANDAYLKAFSQEEGVRSYGLVADYLIAWQQRQAPAQP